MRDPIPKFCTLEMVAHNRGEGFREFTLAGAPSEMYAMRSAFDGLLVEMTVIGHNLGKLRLNVRLKAVAPNSLYIGFLAELYKLTQRTGRSYIQRERIGTFSGFYAKRGRDDHTGIAYLREDLIRRLIDERYSEGNISAVGQDIRVFD